MDHIEDADLSNELAEYNTEAIISENKEKKVFKIQAQVSHKVHCIPEITNYKLDQKKKEDLFNLTKTEIPQIKSETPNISGGVPTHDIFKKHDKNMLADKFSYEAIICEISEKIEP